MYLLIRIGSESSYFNNNKFTFHNVSINSTTDKELNEKLQKFTFHNVSINSFVYHFKALLICNLHSIMYLLIHGKVFVIIKDSQIYIP